MARKKQLVIPLFIPFGGCAHRCVFCNQAGITGRTAMPRPVDVRATIERYLSTWEGGEGGQGGEGRGNGTGRREAAFYGGSFTGLPEALQKDYLESAFEFVSDKRIDALRISTRPDYVSSEKLPLLKKYGVETVELGAQSMTDEVLELSGRGHDSQATVRAVGLLKGEGFKVGLQIMPGLPGDTRKTIINTAREVAGLGPDFVRVYPTLVVRDTPLYAMYLKGEYTPWGLQDMVDVLSAVSKVFRGAGIPVIRMGLQPTEELEETIVAGPYHPSIRQLVERGLTGVDDPSGRELPERITR